MKGASVVLAAMTMVLAHVSALLALTAEAQNVRGGYPVAVEALDPREIAMLPPYCVYSDTFRDRIPGGNNPAMIKEWFARLGPTFYALHHYCWGLMKTNRALLLSRDEATRLFYLRDSIIEFDYVIQRSPTDFLLLPEILSKKGQNLTRLGKSAIAIQEFERAIELKPNYWPPYGYLSDHYKSIGDLKAAVEWLEKGLAVSPDAKGLIRRLTELQSHGRNR